MTDMAFLSFFYVHNIWQLGITITNNLLQQQTSASLYILNARHMAFCCLLCFFYLHCKFMISQLRHVNSTVCEHIKCRLFPPAPFLLLQGHFLSTQLLPPSSYSCFDIHICWNDP